MIDTKQFGKLDKNENERIELVGEKMGKHTPGPWSAHGASVYRGNVKLASAWSEYFREVAPTYLEGCKLPQDGTDDGEGTAYANARLIAAAPDLLAAAEALLNAACEASGRGVSAEIRRMAIPDALFDAACAAIARARGEVKS